MAKIFRYGLSAKRWTAALLAVVLLGTFSTALAGGAWARYWTRAGYLAADDLNHLGQLKAGTDAAFSLLPNGILVKIPYDGSRLGEPDFLDPKSYLRRDGSRPWGDSLPGTAIGISVTSKGELWALVYEPLSRNAFLMTASAPDKHLDNRDWWKVSPALHLQPGSAGDNWQPYGVAADTNGVFVLTDGAFARFDIDRARWTVKSLKRPLDKVDIHNPVTLIQNDRWMWLGTDVGEFGGTLIKADWKSGTAVVVDEKDTVTGLVDDPGHPGCVIFSSGLAHLLSMGAIYRTCGDTMDAIYKGERPIWGLFESEDHLYALVQGGIVPVDKGGLDFSNEMKFPEKIDKALGGLPAYVIANALVIYSQSRWDVSLSGLTPLVVPLPPGAKVTLAPYKAPEAATGVAGSH